MSQTAAHRLAQKSHVILSSGVDWITATKSRSKANRFFYELGQNFVEEEARQGNDMKPLRWQGFSGLISGGATVGLRHDCYYAQLRSDVARDHWQEIALTADNITRLDLQTTVEYAEANPKLIPLAHKYAMRANLGRGRPRALSFITSTTKGDTLYCGRRSSDVYARFYDKGLESGLAPAGKVLRWEVELKSDRAKLNALKLAADSRHQATVHEKVCAHFNSIGVATIGDMSRRVENARVADKSDSIRRLAYLSRVVSPMIVSVLAHYPLSTVLTVLNLDALVIPRPTEDLDTR